VRRDQARANIGSPRLDFQDGAVHDGVTFVNPLASDFDLSSL
jgi:hypothetical protein